MTCIHQVILSFVAAVNVKQLFVSMCPDTNIHIQQPVNVTVHKDVVYQNFDIK